jgi:UDPglucose--hexose-1-phosphate uridylyltransferase
MPELRKDPILGRWVIISSERVNRPTDFHRPRGRKPGGGFCPFCAGNEYTTPTEILAYRPEGSAPNSPGWSLRVVPNKYPALQIEGSLDPVGEELFLKTDGIGAHEVIIETPEHEQSLSTLSLKEVEALLWAYRSRMVDLEGDSRLQYVLIFKNQGPAAGATLEHSHSQLIALPIVPKHVREEVDGSLSYHRRNGRCVYCDIIAREGELRERVVAENEHFVALCPFASLFPFETWIVPKSHIAHYEHSSAQLPSLAALLRESIRRLNAVLDEPDYNYVIHTSPLRAGDLAHYHWHLELIPKVSQVAGFEWGSGFYINPTPPEEAAASLRNAAIDK